MTAHFSSLTPGFDLLCRWFVDLRSLSVLTRGPDAAQWCRAAAELQAQLSSSKLHSHFKSPNSSRQQHYKMFLSCWAKGIMSNFCLWKFFPPLSPGWKTLLQKHFSPFFPHCEALGAGRASLRKSDELRPVESCFHSLQIHSGGHIHSGDEFETRTAVDN